MNKQRPLMRIKTKRFNLPIYEVPFIRQKIANYALKQIF